MEGAKVAGAPVDAAVAALNAGCDMVLLCNQSLNRGRPIDELLDGLVAASEPRPLAGRSGQRKPARSSACRKPRLSPGTIWMHQAGYQRALERLP